MKGKCEDKGEEKRFLTLYIAILAVIPSLLPTISERDDFSKDSHV